MLYATEGAICTIYLGEWGVTPTVGVTIPQFADWEEKLGPGTAEIIFLPPGETDPVSYAPERRESGVWMWRITAAETARAGCGRCELRYTAGDDVVLSTVCTTYVSGGNGDSPVDPEPEPEDPVPHHAGSHAAGGSDPITPKDIGAFSTEEANALYAGLTKQINSYRKAIDDALAQVTVEEMSAEEVSALWDEVFNET